MGGARSLRSHPDRIVISNRLVDLRPQAKECLGWEPKVALREGLASMVDDFKRRLHLED